MKTEKIHNGIIVPAVTPLRADLSLDEHAVDGLFQSFYKYDVHPFILGTTGESASLPFLLKKAYIKKACTIKKAGTKLYAGISSTVLPESIELALYAFENGADAVAATLPSYYQLSEQQMEDYFLHLADAIKAPLIVYNIPATTHMSIPLSVIDRLSKHQHIVAVKDSERSDERMEQSLALWKDRVDFSYLLGWAARSDRSLLMGGDGLIPSTGNFAPEIYAAMWNAAKKNDMETMQQMQRLSDRYGDVYQKDRTLGQSLWALKVLLQYNGIGQAVVMPPLTGSDQKEEQQIIANWQQLKQSAPV